jgi:hypothetical protein
MIWHVRLQPPGRRPLTYVTEHLGPTIQRAVAYRYRHDGYCDYLPSGGRGLFTEVYKVVDLILPAGIVLTEFVRLERCWAMHDPKLDARRLPI